MRGKKLKREREEIKREKDTKVSYVKSTYSKDMFPW